ncbi:MAG: hypothetical protein ACJ765_00670 [Chloroflexota bacterium]
MTALVSVLVIGLVVLVVGFAIGMLVAGPLSRRLDRDDEDPHDV